MAASSVGQRLHVLAVATEADIAAAFDELTNHQVGGLLVNTDPFFMSHRADLISLERRHKLPTVHTIREYTIAGGLMSYGFSIADDVAPSGYTMDRARCGFLAKAAFRSRKMPIDS